MQLRNRKVQQKSNHVVRSVRDLCFCQGGMCDRKIFCKYGHGFLNMKLHDLNVLHLHDGSKVKPRGPASTRSGGMRENSFANMGMSVVSDLRSPTRHAQALVGLL